MMIHCPKQRTIKPFIPSLLQKEFLFCSKLQQDHQIPVQNFNILGYMPVQNSRQPVHNFEQAVQNSDRFGIYGR
jgi:hypothetical protein